MIATTVRQIRSLGPALVLLLASCITQAAILADSVNDWHASYSNDGILDQGEFGWEYGNISNFTGMDAAFYGWHRSVFYWDKARGVSIFWPAGFVPPDVAWGQGGDSTGCRPAMHWADGSYAWAGEMANRWAAVRRWTSSYTGAVDIAGSVGRYFYSSQVPGWDILFAVAINAQTLESPTIYSRYLAWNDDGSYDFFIPGVGLKQGYTVDLLCIPVSGNASNSHVRIEAVISESTDVQSSDLDGNGFTNLRDFEILASNWLRSDCGDNDWCDGADLNRDWSTDLIDVSQLAADWLKPTFPRADFNNDYAVDMNDIAVFARYWKAENCHTNAWCQGCDMNHSGGVDLVDLSEFLDNWLTSVPVALRP